MTLSVVSNVEAETDAEREEAGRLLDLLAGLDELVPRLRIVDLGLLEEIESRVHGPRVHGQGDAEVPAIDADGLQGGLEDPLGLLPHLLDHVGEVDQVALAPEELDVRLVEPHDVGRVAGLEAGRQLLDEHVVPDDRELDLLVLQPGRLRELVDLVLLELVRDRGEVRELPEDELLGPLGVALVDQPPRARRGDAGRGRHLQDLSSRYARFCHRAVLLYRLVVVSTLR